MLTLSPARFVTNAVVKQRGTAKNGTGRFTSGPDGLLARMVGFKGAGSMYAHRYNGQADGTSCPPPTSGGQAPHDLTIPATAVYVVWSFRTPIAWVDADGTVTVPDVYYSVTTTHHQGQCRAWLGAAVPGTSTNLHHIEQGYRSAPNAGLGAGHIWTAVQCPAYRTQQGSDCTCSA